MGAAIDILNPETPKHVAIVASNPATSKPTGWAIGFWWSELTHPHWELGKKGYHVDTVTPKRMRPSREWQGNHEHWNQRGVGSELDKGSL